MFIPTDTTFTYIESVSEVNPMSRRGAGSIVTSEAVVLDFNLAGVGSRSIARSIDTVVQSIAFVLIAIVGAVASVGGVIGIVMFLVGAFLVLFGYPVAMETLADGRTLGKMATGTRVVTVEGAPVKFRHALLRALIAIIDVFLPAGGIAIVSALLTRRGQRLGDLAAGTMVIRDRTAAREATAQSFLPPGGLEAFTATIDARALTPRTYQAIRSFLARAYDMHEPQRSIMAKDLADLARHEVRSPAPPPNTSDSMYLLAVAAAAQTAHGRAPSPPPRPPAPTSQPARFIPPPAQPGFPTAAPATPPLPTPQPTQAQPPSTQPPDRNSGGFAPPG